MDFLPTNRAEMAHRGWDQCDIILVSGDAYIDSPYIGVAMIGRILVDSGFKVGILSQPDPQSAADISRLGEPKLFWGVTGGSIDSMVANYTASGKRRKSDDFTPGGKNTRRPDRAVIAYANLIRRHFKNTKPIVLGGIEASLRRLAHYDAWSRGIRRSILLDSKADLLLYGMADETVVELARGLRDKADISTVRGLCSMATSPPDGCIHLPSFEACRDDIRQFETMFRLFYENCDPITARCLAQQHGNRWLIINPPPNPLETTALDRVYGLGFSRDLHPVCRMQGGVKALETIRFSIPTHRGCYGECSFCAITMHQGRRVTWRSAGSIVNEARNMSKDAQFKGIIHDLGGPTANMYGFECPRKKTKGSCKEKRCLFPAVCPALPIDHSPMLALLEKVASVEKIKRVHITSGIRHDIVLADTKNGLNYLRRLVKKHVSGQMKVAPEHSVKRVLDLMGKPSLESLLRFKKLFDRYSLDAGKKQFLTYYILAAHPGCTMDDMATLRRYALKNWRILPEQVQIFTPTPSTWSTLMYASGRNPWSGEKITVERQPAGKERQKKIMQRRSPKG